jgi:predicted nucleic acid-binding protein
VAKEHVICDTDVIIDYLNINSIRYSSTQNNLENVIGIDNVFLSAVTKMELIMGATNKQDLIKVNKNVDLFSVLIINEDITELAISLLQNYRLSHGLSMPDSLIAATALMADLPLFTYNVKDYKFVKNLKLFDAKT